jgi:hypothetical protein
MEPENALRGLDAVQSAFMPQPVQVRNRLPHGKCGLVQVHLAPEQHLHRVMCMDVLHTLPSAH